MVTGTKHGLGVVQEEHAEEAPAVAAGGTSMAADSKDACELPLICSNEDDSAEIGSSNAALADGSGDADASSRSSNRTAAIPPPTHNRELSDTSPTSLTLSTASATRTNLPRTRRGVNPFSNTGLLCGAQVAIFRDG